MKIINFLISFSILINAVYSRGLSSVTGASCTTIAATFALFPFNCNGSLDLDYHCRCRDPAFLGTVLYCINKYSENPTEISKAYTYVYDTCNSQAGIKYSPDQMQMAYMNATNYMKDSVNKNDTTIDYPVIIEKDTFETATKNVKNLVSLRYEATVYGLAMIAYWGGVIMLFVIHNTCKWSFPFIMSTITSSKFMKWLRRHLVSPHLIKTKYTRSRFVKKLSTVFGSVPIRLHFLIIFFYVVLNIVLCCVNYKYSEPNLIFSTHHLQKVVNFGDRTGIVATVQLPMIFLFGSRNNPLILLSGLNYRIFNLYHKWIARVFTILIIFHAFFYIAFANSGHTYTARYVLEKWRGANVGFGALIILICLGFHKLRKRFYEFFKITHKAFVLMFVVGAWYHCWTLGWIEYFFSAIAFWAYDYFMRAFKVITTGGILKAKATVEFEKVVISNEAYVKSEKVSSQSKVSVYSYKPHSIRLEVNHSGWWKAFPGAFAWIRVLKLDMFWESHPFTILPAVADENYNQLVFVIKIKDGLTKRLAEYISNQPNCEAIIPVMIEGPYGSSTPFKGYDNSLFVAGGIGFTIVYAIAINLAKIYRAQILRGEKRSGKHVVLKWVVPSIELVCLFEKELALIPTFKGIIQVEIFITRPLLVEGETEEITSGDNSTYYETFSFDRIYSDIEAIDQKTKDEVIQSQRMYEQMTIRKYITESVPHISMSVGKRPNVKREVIDTIYDLKGSVAVVACGPEVLNSDVRTATNKCLKSESCSNVDYFEEELLW